MKAGSARTFIMLALGGCICSVPALAQQEQWLEYNITDEGHGYKWIGLSPEPPPGVALPKLQPGALFGLWTNALEKTPRAICLDRTQSGGAYDRLYVDGNGNGKLDDEKPVSPTRRSSSNCEFPATKFVFKGEDGPITYHLSFRCYKVGTDRVQLLASAAGYYSGEVSFDGKKERVQLIDNTLNGVFNDRGAEVSKCDSVLLGKDSETQIYLGELLEVGGKFYTFDVARDGAFVKVKKAENVELGTVQVSEEVKTFAAFGKKGNFTRKPVKGELKLPLGDYQVQRYTMVRKDKNNTEWRLSGSSFEAGQFKVVTANPVRLPIGEPIEAVLEAVPDKARFSFSLKMIGPMGETVDLMRGNERPRAPQLWLASANGQYKSTNTFEYG